MNIEGIIMIDFKFSYSSSGGIKLSDCNLQLKIGSCCLIYGLESKEMSVLSAILGRILPSLELPDIESLQYLYQDYAGDLEIKINNYPEDVSYIGMDPDRHLHFSEVWEEIFVQCGIKKKDEILKVLQEYGLSECFYHRKISSLSGGEKMRLAIAIAFNQNVSLTVLYGVIPWLDLKGRKVLKDSLLKLKRLEKNVIMIEQEYSDFIEFFDTHYSFSQSTLFETNKQKAVEQLNSISLKQSMLLLNKRVSCQKDTVILEAKNLVYNDFPDSTIQREKPLLNKINIKIMLNETFVLLGENGCGKSTLLRIFFRILNPDQGIVLLNGINIKTMKRIQIVESICYIDQFPENQMIYHNIGDCKNIVKHEAFKLDLFNQYFNYPDEYPVTQLAFYDLKILLLLINTSKKTNLLLLDEPTWSMDQHLIEHFIQILIILTKHYCFGIFIITHSIELLSSLESKTCYIKEGELLEY